MSGPFPMSPRHGLDRDPPSGMRGQNSDRSASGWGGYRIALTWPLKRNEPDDSAKRHSTIHAAIPVEEHKALAAL